MLAEGKIDFAVGRFSEISQHHRLDFQPLGNEVMKIVVRHGHPLSALRINSALRLADLAHWPWVWQPLSSPARQLLEREFEHLHIPTPTNTVECDSIFATLQLIQRSDAITALAEPVVRDHLRTQLLSALPIPIQQQLSPYGLLSRKGEALSDIGLEFVTIMQDIVASKPMTT